MIEGSLSPMAETGRECKRDLEQELQHHRKQNEQIKAALELLCNLQNIPLHVGGDIEKPLFSFIGKLTAMGWACDKRIQTTLDEMDKEENGKTS